MMNAFVSGRAGVAFVTDGDTCYSVHINDLNHAIPRRPADYRLLLSHATDVQVLPDVADPATIPPILKEASTRHDAVHMVLMCLDGDLSMETRQAAADALEDELASPDILNYVRSIFYARPLPGSAATKDVAVACANFPKAREFFAKLVELQQAIIQVYQRWLEVSQLYLKDPEVVGEFEQTLISMGAFYDLAKLGSEQKRAPLLITAILNDRTFRRFPSYRRVITEWASIRPVDSPESDLRTTTAPRKAVTLYGVDGTPRKGPAKKRPITPDLVYHNRLVTRFVNRIMTDGKKSIAETIFYRALDQVETKSGRKGIEVFEQAVKNVMPQVEVKPRRVGGATYQVPMEILADRKLSLALRWLVCAARKRNGKTMIDRLASELADAANNTGAAVRQRDDKRKMADANKAFAHYRF